MKRQSGDVNDGNMKAWQNNGGIGGGSDKVAAR